MARHWCGWLAGVVMLGILGVVHGQEAAAPNLRQPKISSLELAAWIDERMEAVWRAQGLMPPTVVDDATFLRRIYLDLAGAIPAVSQVRDFLYASGPFKRQDLIDRLLSDDRRPEQHASRSAEHLARILRRSMIPRTSPNVALGATFEPWLSERLLRNEPYDQIARELLLAGAASRQTVPAGITPSPTQAFYLALGGTPVTSANAVTRYFLGVRLGCAQCHAHPFSNWKQRDFWGMAAFFAPEAAQGQLPQIGDEAGVLYTAKVLWSDEMSLPEGQSPLAWLADWMVAPENPQFAATAVNRIWQHLCGRGLTSVDDLDLVRPEERVVLDELAQQFASSGYNVRWLIEGICKSRYYQRASLSDPADTETPLALRPLKTLNPEQVFDSLEEAIALPIGRVDNPPRYNGLRAAFVARMEEAASDSPEEFGAGIPQALMIMNGKLTADATSLERSRTLRAVVDAPFLKPADKIETLFLATLTRQPSVEELEFLLDHVQNQASEQLRGRAYEEVFWGLLNSPEFMLSR